MVAIIAAFATLSYSALYAGKIFPGVSVANTDLSGQTEGRAREVLSSRIREYGDSQLILRHGEQQWRSTPAEMGLQVDIEGTIEHGYKVGREGGLLERTLQGLQALFNGHPMPLVYTFDRAAQQKVLEGIAAQIDQPVVNASLVVDASGVVRGISARPGRRLDVEATVAQFERSFEVFGTREAKLVVAEVAPRVTEPDLSELKSTAQSILSQPLVLREGEKSWSLSPVDLARMLVLPLPKGSGERAAAQLDENKLVSYLGQIAPAMAVRPQDAAIDFVGGRLVVTESVEGKALDLPATAKAIARELASGNHTVAPVLKSIAPAIATADVARVKVAAETIIGQPLRVFYEDNSWTLGREQLARMLTFSRVEVDGRPQVAAGLDRKSLAKFVEGIAPRINRKPRDARFTFASGKVSVLSESVDGLSVNIDETVEAINVLAATSHRQASLVVRTEKAAVQSSDVASIVIKDLLSSATTSYAGGIPARNHNVELATGRLNGVVVPPGEVFSFNFALGPTTLDSGFRVGYGIAMSGTTAITVESVGGGICQVATTLYHASFWAGLEIVERLPHLYWIPRYGQPPKGMKGLDATVDDPWVDLKIKNNTGNWIAIQSKTANGNVVFSIYGVDPGWKVTAEGPYIRNVVPADTTMIEEEDPSMPEGTTLLVEHAEDGFDSTVIRHIQKDGKEIDRYEVKSRYRPSRNVLLVPKKTTPEPEQEPTPTPTPAPTVTPASTPWASPGATPAGSRP